MTIHDAPAALLVGSVNLDNADEVFDTVGRHLGGLIRSVPDGETGDRLGWVMWQCDRLRRIPELDVVQALEFTSPGTGRVETTTFLAPADGVDLRDVRLGPLGYADHALRSYRSFVAAKRSGALPDEVRFQVSLPTPMMLAMLFPGHRADALPLFEKELASELIRIAQTVPHDELAIQWDIAGETQHAEMLRWHSSGWTGERWPIDDAVDSIALVSAFVPDASTLGVHLCYGDAGGAHLIEPIDTSAMVDLAGRLLRNVSRRIDWVHMPVPLERDDEDYVAPLADLHLPPATTLHLGLVHREDGVDGARRRARSAARVVDRFGVATECGMGREKAADIPGLLDIHRIVAADGHPRG
ncbi:MULTISPECIES: hypothetical protein [Pseudonocardia]|uniref:Uncharacterized protein n=2 Tax=Pseudonocardia TaxID=1847 RepID=A0A1Y2MLG2_PSEAH|nr:MULTISPECIES: hypothetical protein [Pseudonocardia]OSY35497.1 hypothetical protein BG845_06035 [Pseudonocardia autotrophica]TDN76972.1 hypothetical protein C8E95_6193 [Pseudonocardia autotrophica]BBG00976.1 hypothetical protein Pdca_21850 [Pseudonocardia autotrophica]GEC29464.1 hypothetical protein PSA01_64930 [Pseudonocardia saturnea]